MAKSVDLKKIKFALENSYKMWWRLDVQAGEYVLLGCSVDDHHGKQLWKTAYEIEARKLDADLLQRGANLKPL